MYFWRIEELKSKVIASPLTDREVLPYLLIFVGITGLIPIFPVESMTLWDYVGAVWTFLLAVFGTIYVYRCNGGATGKDFLQRYLAIGWVVTIRWAAIVMPLFVLLIFAVDPSSEETEWYVGLFFVLAEVVLYERIGHHIRAVARVPLRSNTTVETDAREAARGSP